MNRSNPFCTRFVRPGAIPFRFESGSAEKASEAAEIVHELIAIKRGLIVGPHGTGKSTLLMTLMPMLREAFAAAELVSLHAPTPHASRIDRFRHRQSLARQVLERSRSATPGGVVVVDGIEQLGRLATRALRRIAERRQLGLLATSHREIRHWKTLFRARLDPALVLRLTDSLLADSPDVVADAVRASVGARDLTTVDNLREFWFELYDVAAQQHVAARQHTAERQHVAARQSVDDRPAVVS